MIAKLALSLLLTASAASAQEGSPPAPFNISVIIEDINGNPVTKATLNAHNGIFFANDGGRIEAVVEAGSVIMFKAPGYKTITIDLSNISLPEALTMYKQSWQTGDEHRVPLPIQLSIERRYHTGAISTIGGEQLVPSPEPLLSNTLQGHGLGLVAVSNAGGMSNNPASLYLRGLPRETDNTIITVVDGIERPIDHLMAEEIASIELLKDPVTKIIYGPRAANGVLMITTKRGNANEKRMNVNADFGIGTPSRLPEFLNAHDYVALYNEARMNDGFVPVYSDKEIEGYRNSSGENDIWYPDADYYDYFLRDHTNFAKITAEFSGGSDNAGYFLMLGYVGSNGLEAIGPRPSNDRINIRGNLNLEISDLVSAYMDIAGRFEIMERSRTHHAAFFEKLSSHRPNEYPFIIDNQYVPADTLGNPALGASYYRAGNLYGDLVYGGYQKNQYFSGQTNFGLNFDFDKYVSGLSAKAYVTFDNYFFGAENLNNQPSLYARRVVTNSEGQDSLVFQQLQRDNYDPQLRLSSNENLRNTGLASSISYRNTFGQHFVNADIAFQYALNEQTGDWVTQHIENSNTVFRSVYAFRNRYIAEFALAYMGSNKFDGDNRYQTFPAGGIAWIVSEESFMDRADVINFLKVRANAGVLGYDRATSHWLYRDRWQNFGSVSFGDPDGTNVQRVNHSMRGNPGLEWEKSREITAGIETVAMDHRLFLEMNYFNEYRYDIIHFVSAQIPSIYGSRFANFNWGEVKNEGIELMLKWHDRREALHYSFGINYLYSENKIISTDAILYPDEYRNIIGLPGDAMMGYATAGLFGPDADLEGHAFQTFGHYGIGDIAYVDLNGDGMIDDRDRQMLGNSFPRHTMGLNIAVNYKGWGIYLLATAHMGVSTWLNNSYYWNSGNDKYSVITLDRYHPENNPGGTYPRLTTTDGSNNFRNSDFWLENSSFLRLKNAEISYTINSQAVGATPRSVKIYARGSNLFVVSALKELDPEALNGGLTNYPVLTSVSVGLAVSF